MERAWDNCVACTVHVGSEYIETPFNTENLGSESDLIDIDPDSVIQHGDSVL